MKNLYSIYDDVAKDSLAPFTAKNDDHAQLMVRNSIKNHQFDNLSLSDTFLICLGSFDSDNCSLGEIRNETVCCIDDLLDEIDKDNMKLEKFFKDLTVTFNSDVKKALEDLRK